MQLGLNSKAKFYFPQKRISVNPYYILKTNKGANTVKESGAWVVVTT